MAHKWWVLSAVACGTFMATLDSSIVNIALPTLTKSLDTDLYRIKWVVIAYLLVITCLLLPFGRLSDQYGRKKIFQMGFLVFTLGSACCGLAPNLGFLLLSRFIQGLGASMLMANGPAIITTTFPASERGKALGTLAMVVSAGLVTGPSIGGLLITTLGWRSIFLVNIPVGILGMILVYHYVPPEQEPKAAAPFDWAGALLQMILLFSFIIVVDPPSISISGSTPFPVSRILMGILTVIFGAIFVKVELEAKAPLFDLSLLKIRTFWTANLASLLTFISYSSLSVLMPFFLEEVLHLTPDKAGLFMTAIPLTIFVVAPISGRLSDKLGSQELSFIGAMVGALGLFFMSGAFGLGIHEHVSRAAIVMGLCSIGLATGLFQSPNNNSIMAVVPSSKLGVASALLATVRNLGLVAGTGLATGLFAWRQQSHGDFVEALHFTFFIAGLVALGAMVASLGKKRGPHHQGTHERKSKS
jgi:EmrB/QacA subfamily drug resistance transporter